jgi:hypothetical protein
VGLDKRVAACWVEVKMGLSVYRVDKETVNRRTASSIVFISRRGIKLGISSTGNKKTLHSLNHEGKKIL